MKLFKKGDRLVHNDRNVIGTVAFSAETSDYVEVDWSDGIFGAYTHNKLRLTAVQIQNEEERIDSDDFHFTASQLNQLLSDLKQGDKLERIRYWSGMAIQGIASAPANIGRVNDIAEYAFDLAEAMEDEYISRYFNE